MSKPKNHDDMLADDCESWINNGQHQFFWRINKPELHEWLGREASFNTSSLT